MIFRADDELRLAFGDLRLARLEGELEDFLFDVAPAPPGRRIVLRGELEARAARLERDVDVRETGAAVARDDGHGALLTDVLDRFAELDRRARALELDEREHEDGEHDDREDDAHEARTEPPLLRFLPTELRGHPAVE